MTIADPDRESLVHLALPKGRMEEGVTRLMNDAGIRLMVEIEHARLGRMQIDALIRPHRFDLIVRSHTELPLGLREKLAAIHDEARDIASLAGTIGFQWAGAFVAPPLAAEHLGVTA